MLLAWLGLQAGLGQPLQAAGNKLTITDSGIAAAVETDLRMDKAVPPAIGVNTSQGIVTLTGSVNNVMSRKQARNIAESIRGVRGVINEIVVTPAARPDDDIRKDVLLALLQDPATEAYPVHVSVAGGLVTLSGTVGSWAESQLAARVAQEVRGVTAVTNKISIKYTGKRTDQEIAADVNARLRWDAWLVGDPIQVQVDAGKVMLTGETGSLSARNRAEVDGWVNGVQAVNVVGLKVNPEITKKVLRKGFFSVASDQIRQAVLAAFRYDPRLRDSSISVRVEEDEVTLTGQVTHVKAIGAAGQDAWNTVGVVAVDNLLTVNPLWNWPSDADVQKALSAALARKPRCDRSGRNQPCGLLVGSG